MRLAYFGVSMSQIARPSSLGLAPPVGLRTETALAWRKYRESQGQDCWRGNSRRDFAPDAAHFANKAEHSDSGSVRTHWDHARPRRESYR